MEKWIANQHVRNFLFILVAALASAVLGALFAVVVALLSPEFLSELLRPETDSVIRYAAAVGMIWGLFIGAGAMAFSLGVAAIAHWFRPRKKSEES